jgi:hypothetical protein
MQKIPLVEFVYNNSVYNTISISPFFVIYRFYFNMFSTIRDDRLEEEVFTAREVVD